MQGDSVITGMEARAHIRRLMARLGKFQPICHDQLENDKLSLIAAPAVQM